MAYRIIPGGYIDETGPHRGVPPQEDAIVRKALELTHRMIFDGSLTAHLDMMNTPNAKRMYKEMKESAEFAGKYLFEGPKE